MLASEIVRRVKAIQIRTGRQVADVLAGGYQSVFRGAGIEFDEVRPYLVGDDVRSIDWNVTARAGSPFVKRYVEERQLSLMLVADVSASQDFGSAARSKREAAAELCALLAFSAIRNDDRVGLVLFHGEVEQYIPPRKGQKHALRVVREVLAHGEGPGQPARQRSAAARRAGRGAGAAAETHTPAARLARLVPRRLRGARARFANRRALRSARQATSIARAMEFVLSVCKRRTVCFVVSDFLDTGFEPALSMANRRHDVIAVLITDPRELAMPAVGLVALSDAETGEARLYDTGSQAFRERLARAGEERVRELQRSLRRRGVDCIHVDAAADVIEPLVAFFRMRDRRQRR